MAAARPAVRSTAAVESSSRAPATPAGAPSPAQLAHMDAPPGMLLPRRQKLVIMSAILLAMFTMAVNQTIISVALPRIVADLGGLDLFAWPLTAYLLASTAPVPVFGKLSDIYGRKPFILAGLVVFLAGTALCGTAQDMTQLIVFRAVQGLGGGLIMATTFTAIGDLYSPSERGRWSGVFSGVFALASIVGPLVGGSITDHLSWRWVFFINLPIGIFALVAVGALLPWFKTGRRQPIDFRGGFFLMLAAGGLLLGLSWAGNQYGWGEAPVLIAFTLAGSGLALFVATEWRVGATAVLPLALFKRRAYVVSIGALAVVGLGMFGTMQFVSLFVQGVQGSSATNSGLVTMPMMGGLVVGSILAGQAVSRVGRYRELAVLGAIVSASGAFMLSTLEADSSQNLTRAYMVLMGFGVGVAMPLYSLIIQNTLPYSLLGVGSSSSQFFRQIGGTMGVAVFGSIMISGYVSNLGGALALPGVEVLADSPRLLLDPERLAAFQAQVDAAAPGTAETAIATARVALSGAITDLFFIGAVIMAVAVFFAAALPNAKLRTAKEMMAEMTSMRQPGGAVGAAATAAPGGDAPTRPPRPAGAAPAAAPLAAPPSPPARAGASPAQTAPSSEPSEPRPVTLPPPTRPVVAVAAPHPALRRAPARASLSARVEAYDAALFGRAAGVGAMLGLAAAIVPRVRLAWQTGEGEQFRRGTRDLVRDARRRASRSVLPAPRTSRRRRRERWRGDALGDFAAAIWRTRYRVADRLDPPVSKGRR